MSFTVPNDAAYIGRPVGVKFSGDGTAYPTYPGWSDFDNASLKFTPAAPSPEPGAMVLLATGLLSLLCYAWRKRK